MFFKKLRYVALCLFFVAAFSAGAFAAESGGYKIGIMNVQKVLVMSDAGLQAKELFEVKKNELESSIQIDEDALKKLAEEIEKKSSVWSKEKKDEQVLEFNRMRRDLNTKKKDSEMEMKRLQNKELEPIIKELEQVVDNFGEREGYTLILDSKNGVIFSDKSIDISDALIEELNKAMK